MNDERFNHDLLQVLREAAGEEAPMSLRSRISRITDEAPISRRLWFSPPMRLSVAAVSVVAVLVLAFLLMQRDSVGPGPSQSPEPTPSMEQSATAVPSVAPTPIPTVEPTPLPTRALTTWTGLVWSDPVTPSFTVHLYDLLPWGDGYVAVGEVPGQGGASFTSSDGLNWTIGKADFPGEPEHVVRLGDELLAFLPEFSPNPPGSIVGAPPTTEIWRSPDGVAWSRVDSMSWYQAWYQAVIDAVVGTYPGGWDPTQHELPLGVVDVASGPNGLVAIGNSFGDDAMAPIILHSSDGLTWTQAELPSGSASALLNAVVVHGDRFVITGATGVWTDPATATAAAWYSDDGYSWTAAAIEPAEADLAAGAELGPVWAADNGLVACSGNREMGAGGWRFMQGWVSPDGASWRYAQTPGPHPACDWSASDGTRIVALGSRPAPTGQPWPGVTVASVSTDGATWQSLELGSALNDRLERFWVVPDGVIYAGEQSFWFGTAIER